MKNIRIALRRTVPLYARWILTAILVITSVWIMQNLTEEIAIVLSIISCSLLTPVWYTYEVMSIDNSSQSFQCFYWLMGKKFAKKNRKFIREAVVQKSIDRAYSTTYKVVLLTTDNDEYTIKSYKDESKALELKKSISIKS